MRGLEPSSPHLTLTDLLSPSLCHLTSLLASGKQDLFSLFKKGRCLQGTQVTQLPIPMATWGGQGAPGCRSQGSLGTNQGPQAPAEMSFRPASSRLGGGGTGVGGSGVQVVKPQGRFTGWIYTQASGPQRKTKASEGQCEGEKRLPSGLRAPSSTSGTSRVSLRSPTPQRLRGTPLCLPGDGCPVSPERHGPSGPRPWAPGRRTPVLLAPSALACGCSADHFLQFPCPP